MFQEQYYTTLLMGLDHNDSPFPSERKTTSNNKVRRANLPKLETEIRRILACLKHSQGEETTAPRVKEADHYFYMVRRILSEAELVTFKNGFHDKKKPNKSTPAQYEATPRLKVLLQTWDRGILEPLVIKDYHKKYLHKPLNEFYAMPLDHSFPTEEPTES